MKKTILAAAFLVTGSGIAFILASIHLGRQLYMGEPSVFKDLRNLIFQLQTEKANEFQKLILQEMRIMQKDFL